jgi:hypothetical protein
LLIVDVGEARKQVERGRPREIGPVGARVNFLIDECLHTFLVEGGEHPTGLAAISFLLLTGFRTAVAASIAIPGAAATVLIEPHSPW